MQQARFAEAVAGLRRWVEDPEPRCGRPMQAGTELARLASEVYGSLRGHRSGWLLPQRARHYSRGVVGDRPFQKMCTATRLWVLRGWRRVWFKTGHLSALPFRAARALRPFPGDEEQPPELAHWLARSTDRSEGSAEAPFPYSSRLGLPVEGRQDVTPASVLPDLEEFTGHLEAEHVALNLPRFIYQVELIATLFEGEPGAWRDTPAGFWRSLWRVICYVGRVIAKLMGEKVGEKVEWARFPQRLRMATSFFWTVLRWADKDHLRGSYLLEFCYTARYSDDPSHLSRAWAKSSAADLKEAGRVMLAAAEDIGRRAEEEGARPAPSPPAGMEAGAVAGDHAGAGEAPEGRAEEGEARPAPATPPAVDEGVGPSGRAEPAEASEVRVEEAGGQPAPSLPPAAEADAITGARAGAAEAPEPADHAAALDDSTTAGPVPLTSETTQAAQAGARPAVEEGAAAGGQAAAGDAPEGRTEEVGDRPAPSTPPGVDEGAFAGGVPALAEAPGGRAATPPADVESTDGGNRYWAAPGSGPPEGFHEIPLLGQQNHIILALKEVGILTHGTRRELEGKLDNKMVLTGERAGGEYCVYISKRHEADRARRALQALEVIKAGLYHVGKYQLEPRYEKHKKFALRSSEEATLAHVLRAVDVLTEDTVACLHEMLESEEALCGTYKEGHFTLYLSDDCPVEKACKARDLLGS
jgi:hypothetical protein